MNTTPAAAAADALLTADRNNNNNNNTTELSFDDELAIKEALSSTQINQNEVVALKDQLRIERLAINKKMVHKYQSQFPNIPTMTSIELVERWKQQDRDDDERDSQSSSSSSSSSSIDSNEHASQSNSPKSRCNNKVGPLLLLDVRSKSERNVSIIPGAVSMDDLETTRWINKYVHNFEGKQLGIGIPTIVTYCTIGYRSGREAQRLYDDLTTTFGIDINNGCSSSKVEIKNLDGILAYSFVDSAPPLMYPATSDGGSDYHMTKRIHSFGKEWSIGCNPEYDVVYFKTKPKLFKHLLQTGFVSALRGIQHLVCKCTNKVKETSVIKNVCVEPLPILNLNIGIPKMLGGNGNGSHNSTNDLTTTALDNNNDTTDSNTLKRISLSGYTTNVNHSAAILETDTCTVATTDTTSNNTTTTTIYCVNNNHNNNNYNNNYNNISATTTNETAVRELYYVP